jgi:hypothetical protein
MYLKDITHFAEIPPDLRQTFENQFNLNVGKNEIIKMRNGNVITDRDVAIAKFLFQFRFATAEQIYRLIGDDKSKSNIRSRLDKLVKYRVINKFMLGSYEEERVAHDAFQGYCLDLGGRYLLANFSNEDISDWYSTVNMRTSELISKDLAVTEFYLRVWETVPDRLLYFKVNPEFRVGKKSITPSFEMGMSIGGMHRYFVGEVFRDFDFPMYARERIAKDESLLMTNAWKKYYYDTDAAPVLFLVAGDDVNALELSKLTAETTTIENFRITTDIRLKKVLYDTGAFLKYESTKGVLQEIKASTFRP